MSESTPGPWSVLPNGVCVVGPFEPGPGDDPKQKTAGIAMCGMRLRTNEEAEANARLTAAAPDLLAACLRAEEFICNGIEFGYIRMPGSGDSALETLPAIRAAICKATEGAT